MAKPVAIVFSGILKTFAEAWNIASAYKITVIVSQNVDGSHEAFSKLDIESGITFQAPEGSAR
jgi:hypothetical protein